MTNTNERGQGLAEYTMITLAIIGVVIVVIWIVSPSLTHGLGQFDSIDFSGVKTFIKVFGL